MPCLKSLLCANYLAFLLMVAPVYAQNNKPDSAAVIGTAILSAQSLFQFDSSELTAGGRASLENLINDLQRFQSIQTIRVVGHTDSVGPEAYNQLLSERRAVSIARILQKRYPNIHLVSVGAGESIPISPNATREGRRENRRVEIEIIATGLRQLAQ